MKPMLLFWALFLAGSALAQVQRNTGVAGSVNLSATDTSYWQTQTTGIAGSTLFALSTVDRNVCWLAGASGTIIRTVDGGNTWSPINPGIINTQDIHVFEGVNDSIAFASTTPSDTTYIYRTTNAGSSWGLVSSQPAGFIFAIKMFNPTKGIAVGDPVGGRWMILKTTTGGETWFRTPTEPPQISGASGGTRFGTFDSNYVWFIDNRGRQYLSPNSGDTWSYSSDSISTSHMWVLCMNTPDLWLFVGYVSVFRWTRYGGWVSVGPAPGFPFDPTGLVGALRTTEFWLVQRAVYYTSNAGSAWTSAPPNGLNKPVALIDMVTLGSEVSAWATGVGDTVYHYHRIVTGVEGYPEPIPREFSLSQNYPNPFNPSTRIEFEVPRSEFVSLKVYDVLGREVVTLVNEEMGPGSYERVFDGSGLASGVYYYRVTSGSFSVTRKLILLR